jgi:hypothetical protein
MTSREHTAQRDLVAASLRAQDDREARREVFRLAGRYAGREAVQTRRESMRPMRAVRTSGRWT